MNTTLEKPIVLFIGVIVLLSGTSGALADESWVVGDSLARQTYGESGGWHVNARNGRTLRDAGDLVDRIARNREPDALVVALGSNDVSLNSRQMRSDIDRAASHAVNCVVLTTVKVMGVISHHRRNWIEVARRWNRHVWRSGAVVANWNIESHGHRNWFLGDGLHLTTRGKNAYDRMLRRVVADQC